jgi:hypothetical protein
VAQMQLASKHSSVKQYVAKEQFFSTQLVNA